MRVDRNSKTFKISLGGIFLALTIIFLWGASFVPRLELTLFACSSLFVGFMIMETGVGGGLLLYAAACILGLIILPNKLAIIPFACIFGYYGIVKYYIEKVPSIIGQLLLKACLFAGVITCLLLVFKSLLASAISLPDYPAWLLIAGWTAMMIAYDFIYSYLLKQYELRIQHKGLDHIKLS